jgi:hypothetical protein
MKYINLKAVLACVMAISLAGCGGKIEATIGGSVSGLSGGTSMVLQDNGGDNLTISSNGSFTFAKQIEAGSTYNVTILTQPIGETCTIENAYGTVEQSVGNVNSVAVICNATISASNEVLGTVTGLTTGQTVTLTNNGTNALPLTGNASGTLQTFVFSTPLASGQTYNVAISAKSTGVTCTLSNNIGTIPVTGTITPVSLVCN